MFWKSNLRYKLFGYKLYKLNNSNKFIWSDPQKTFAAKFKSLKNFHSSGDLIWCRFDSFEFFFLWIECNKQATLSGVEVSCEGNGERAIREPVHRLEIWGSINKMCLTIFSWNSCCIFSLVLSRIPLARTSWILPYFNNLKWNKVSGI